MTGASFTPAYALRARRHQPAGKRPAELRHAELRVRRRRSSSARLWRARAGQPAARARRFSPPRRSASRTSVYGVIVLPESAPARAPQVVRHPAREPARQHCSRCDGIPPCSDVLGALVPVGCSATRSCASTWAFYAQYRFGWSAATIGLSLAVAGTVHGREPSGLCCPRSYRASAKRRTALTGIAIACVGYLGYATATTTAVMLALARDVVLRRDHRDAEHERACSPIACHRTSRVSYRSASRALYCARPRSQGRRSMTHLFGSTSPRRARARGSRAPHSSRRPRSPQTASRDLLEHHARARRRGRSRGERARPSLRGDASVRASGGQRALDASIGDEPH